MSVFYFTCPLKTPPIETDEVFSLNMNDQPIQRRHHQRRLSSRSPTTKTCSRGDSVLATTDASRIRPANPPRHALTWWSTNPAFRRWEAMLGGPVVCCLLCLVETIAWLTPTATPNITPMINGVVFVSKCAETVGCQ
jgi:hypothetical protein